MLFQVNKMLSGCLEVIFTRFRNGTVLREDVFATNLEPIRCALNAEAQWALTIHVLLSLVDLLSCTLCVVVPAKSVNMFTISIVLVRHLFYDVKSKFI